METTPNSLTVQLSDTVSTQLPLVRVREDLSIYSFDLMGRANLNRAAAETLSQRIRQLGVSFDIFLTVEAKGIGLTENLSGHFGHDDYVVVRKSQKVYMDDPITIAVNSITTDKPQQLFLGREKLPLLRGKSVAIIEDVVSTAGTLSAVMELAQQAEFTIPFIACALTEGEDRKEYCGIPIVKIGHIPIPKA